MFGLQKCCGGGVTIGSSKILTFLCRYVINKLPIYLKQVHLVFGFGNVEVGTGTT